VDRFIREFVTWIIIGSLFQVIMLVVPMPHMFNRLLSPGGVGRVLGVGCGLGVGKGLGVAVGVGVGVGVWVAVAVALAVGVGVGVGVTPPDNPDTVIV
jgi:hypothetical protein